MFTETTPRGGAETNIGTSGTNTEKVEIIRLKRTKEKALKNKVLS
jgi:hypothetical protein